MAKMHYTTRGQSVIEVIVAVGVFGIIAGSLISMAVGGFSGLLQGGKHTEAQALADEAIESVKAVYGRAWNELLYSTSSVSIEGGRWEFEGEGTTETIGEYTRTITFRDVCRDSFNDIVMCPGAYTDIDTKEVLVTVSWSPRESIINRVTGRVYITNWESREWIQTDWDGGDGEVTWEDETAFASSTGIDAETNGEVILDNGTSGSWENAGGELRAQTSVDDFLGGTFFDTEVVGVGILGSVKLSLIASSTDYHATGTYFSSVIDSGTPNTLWGIISWTETLTAQSDVIVLVRSGDSAVPDVSWSSWSSELIDETGSLISVPDARYLQYRVNLTRGTTTTETPTLDAIEVIYNAPTLENIQNVDGVSLSDVWAVAGNATLLHYDGDEWTESTISGIGSTALNDLFMISNSEGWITCSGGKVLSYDGNEWDEFIDTGNENWNSIVMVGTSTGFMVGDAIGGDGTVALFDGISWTADYIIGLNANLTDVYALGDANVWAVGESGKIAHYDGDEWAENSDLGEDDINGLYMRTASNGWAVGSGGKIYHYDGSAWSEHTDTGEEVWNEITLRTTNMGWAVGDGGVIATWDGDSWTIITPTTGQDLFGITTISSDGWAVGARGTILALTDGSKYVTSGTLISSGYDMGAVLPIQGIEWDSTIPSCDPECAVVLQLSAAGDSGGSPGEWTDWYGANGSETYFTNATGSMVTKDLNAYRWVRYQAILTGDGDETPVLEEVRVNHK